MIKYLKERISYLVMTFIQGKNWREWNEDDKETSDQHEESPLHSWPLVPPGYLDIDKDEIIHLSLSRFYLN